MKLIIKIHNKTVKTCVKVKNNRLNIVSGSAPSPLFLQPLVHPLCHQAFRNLRVKWTFFLLSFIAGKIRMKCILFAKITHYCKILSGRYGQVFPENVSVVSGWK